MKKPAYPHADAHLLARARMTARDYALIAEETRKALQQANEEREQRRRAEGGRALPPHCNTGGEVVDLRLANGEIKQVTKRVHSLSDICFIDWLHVSCHEDSFKWGKQAVTDDQVIADVSLVCEAIFGFGITAKRDRGALFYQCSYDLGDKFGLICHGGQNNTVLIQLNGTGCAAAANGWERRMYDFLNSADRPTITRVDLAHDDYEGDQFNPDALAQAFDDGLFDVRGHRPHFEQRGNWRNPNGEGRTLYIGKRTSSKFFRGYEKGRQLGDPDSKWMRLEVEFKSCDRIIPHDCLLYPHEYFAGAYPLLSTVCERVSRILTTQRTVQASYERTKRWLKHQCGAALHAVHQIEGDAEKALAVVVREGKTPRGLEVPSFTNTGDFIHERGEQGFTPAHLIDYTKED